MKWISSLVVPEDLRERDQIALRPEKVVKESRKPESQKQSSSLQLSTFTTQKQQSREKVCKVKSKGENLGADPCERVEREQQKEDPYLAQVRRDTEEARARHEAWRVTLRPAPKHVCRKLVPEEERHLRDFIKTKLVVAPRRGDTFYHMSGSDLWRLQGEYERATGFEFSMRIDYFDWYVAQATGAQVMDGEDGQRWLIGVSYS